ncbi:unnamed protein product, partial [Ectocarpus fasciculatus]
MPPDMADIVALRSQLAELGVMAGFLDPSSPTVAAATGSIDGRGIRSRNWGGGDGSRERVA